MFILSFGFRAFLSLSEGLWVLFFLVKSSPITWSVYVIGDTPTTYYNVPRPRYGTYTDHVIGELFRCYMMCVLFTNEGSLTLTIPVFAPPFD